MRVGLSVVVALAGLVGMTAQDASATTQTFTAAGADELRRPRRHHLDLRERGGGGGGGVLPVVRW